MSDWLERNLPCTHCNSSDALQESTHHFKCFSCGNISLKRDLDMDNPNNTVPKQNIITTLIDVGDFLDLTPRAITKETCEKYKITCVKYTGSFGYGNKLHYVNNHWVYVFSQYYNGQLTKQKIRSVENKKDMKILGDGSLKELYGQSLFPPKIDRFVVIVEGEFDAAAVYQSTGFITLSVRSGADGTLTDLKNNIDYLQKFKYVVLALDNDEAGRNALQKVLDDNPFDPGKLRIATWPVKDPNEMLIAGNKEDIKRVIWDAEEYKPKDLYFPEDLIETALIKPQKGVDTPWPDLTDSLMGWRLNSIVTVAASDGIGKTELVDEIVHQFVTNNNMVWLYSCEQEPEETLIRQVGKNMNLPIHIPGIEWNEKDLRSNMKKLKGKLIMWRPEKATGSDALLERMKYVSIAYGVKYFILDHLKGIESQMTDVNNSMGRFLSDIKLFVKTHNSWVLLLSHVAKDKKQGRQGKEDESWNRGRVPTKENIYGSSAITAWSDVILGLSRNVESENPRESCVTRIDILKNRLMGNRGFKRVFLEYNNDTGRLVQTCPIDYENEND